MFRLKSMNWHQVCLSKPVIVVKTSKLQHHEYLIANAVPLFQIVNTQSPDGQSALGRGIGRV